MVQADVADRLVEKTGYSSFRSAFTAAKYAGEGRAVWHCLEVVRPVVRGIVGQYVRFLVHKKLPSLISGEDLEQAAFESLIAAIKRFDLPDIGSDLECRKAWSRYASMVVRSPVRDVYVRHMGPVSMPDWAVKIASRLTKAMHELEMEQYEKAISEGRSPSFQVANPRMIAAKAGVEYSKVKRFMDTGMHFLPGQRFTHNIEADTPAAKGDAYAYAAEPSSDPAVKLTEGQDELLDESMQLLNSRQKYVIARLYGLDGRAGTYKSVGKVLKIDPEQVAELERAAMAQLKAAFMEEDMG